MTEHLRLIARQLAHLQRMREYLTYSTQRAQRILPITNWRTLSLEQHETLAAIWPSSCRAGSTRRHKIASGRARPTVIQ